MARIFKGGSYKRKSEERASERERERERERGAKKK
jgi:hypothetical protein